MENKKNHILVVDDDNRIRDLLKEANCEILSFCRLEVGEGIETKEEDFAAEVAAQLKDSS